MYSLLYGITFLVYLQLRIVFTICAAIVFTVMAESSQQAHDEAVTQQNHDIKILKLQTELAAKEFEVQQEIHKLAVLKQKHEMEILAEKHRHQAELIKLQAYHNEVKKDNLQEHMQNIEEKKRKYDEAWESHMEWAESRKKYADDQLYKAQNTLTPVATLKDSGEFLKKLLDDTIKKLTEQQLKVLHKSTESP